MVQPLWKTDQWFIKKVNTELPQNPANLLLVYNQKKKKKVGNQTNYLYTYVHSFPGSLDGKASAYDAGDPGLVPGLGRSPGEGNGNLLQYSWLENPMDRGAWWAIVHGVANSQTRLSDFFFLMFIAALLFTTAKRQKQLKCPSTNEHIKKMCCV